MLTLNKHINGQRRSTKNMLCKENRQQIKKHIKLFKSKERAEKSPSCPI